MSIRTKVLGLVDVMMRVPPILLIDKILKVGMGLPIPYFSSSSSTSSSTSAPPSVGANDEFDSNKGMSLNPLSWFSKASEDAVQSNVPAVNETLERAIENISEIAAKSGLLGSTVSSMMTDITKESSIADLLTLTSIRFLLCFMFLIFATCVFMLWTRHLVMFYMFAVSFGVTFLSYWLNSSAILVMEKSPSLLKELLLMNTEQLRDPNGVFLSVLPYFVAQWFLGMLFAYIHMGPRYEFLQKSMSCIFASPILLNLLPLPACVSQQLSLAAGLVPLILTTITLVRSGLEASKTIYNGYQYAMNFVTNFGLSALIENEWQRLNVPSVLRVFWTIRIAQNFIAIIWVEGITIATVLPILQKLLVDGCETLTAVLGMTAVISLVCHYVGKAFQSFLLTVDNTEEKSLGTVSAVLFYILALQTGLTSLVPDKRFVRLCRNLCLLFTALLHFLHNIVSPILMSLSAARNPSRERHLRALTVCVFLVVAPIGLLSLLWTRHMPSTWLLAVTAFSVEVVVKVLVSLATYTLFLLDARRQTFWEKLDDYLYYVRAFGNSVEFCFGILLFFNGAWILLFESANNATGGAIRAIMMCIHAYFNIWCEARTGWSVFMKRRSAVHKISSLPEATTAQLRAFDDVCAICYQEMYSAKITRCRHYFHGVCLRKWLYVQDRCPLCHEIMMYTERTEEGTVDPNRAAQAAQQQMLQQQEQQRPQIPVLNDAGAVLGTPAASTAASSHDASTTTASTLESTSTLSSNTNHMPETRDHPNSPESFGGTIGTAAAAIPTPQL